MSKSTKRKHVTREVLDDYFLPKDDEMIVKVLGGRGNNLHEIETSNGEKYLVSMPTKFRKNVWIKRGDFVLTKPIEEGDKVKAEIVRIIYANQIKYIQNQGKWPEGFNAITVAESPTVKDDEESDSSDSDSGDLFVNTNKPQCTYESSEESDEEEENSDDCTDDDEEIR